MRFSGLVNADGALKLDNREEFKDALCKMRGKRVELEIEADHPRRSNQQNRRFFIIVSVAREILNQELEQRGSDLKLTKEQTHSWIDERFLGNEETHLGKFRRRCS